MADPEIEDLRCELDEVSAMAMRAQRLASNFELPAQERRIAALNAQMAWSQARQIKSDLARIGGPK